MPKAIHLDIPIPCHENWNQMTPHEQGRFCLSCQKTVVDFTMMSDKEVVEYFNKSTSQVCGRFANDQLQRDLPMSAEKKRWSWGYFWSMLVAGFMISNKGYTQGAPVAKKVTANVKKVKLVQEPPRLLGEVAPVIVPETRLPGKVTVPVPAWGRVFDAVTSLPILGASIRVAGSGRGVAADSTGSYRLNLGSDEMELEFSAIGYQTEIKKFRTGDGEEMKIFLTPMAATLHKVEVIGFESRCFTGMVGGISSTYRVSKTEKIKRKINDWMPTIIKKDVQVYPNPVVRGNSVNLILRLPKTGEYKGELLSASGQVMAVQSIRVTSAAQQVSIPTQNAWSAGIYWLRITHPQLKKVYQSKVVVQ